MLFRSVTTSQEEYINKAVYFSKNLDKLTNLKQEVRNAFINSPICNYKEFVDEFEEKLFTTYKNHKW